jgi:hypothetical protein
VEISLQLHQASLRGIISSSDLNLWLTPNMIVQHPNCSWTFYTCPLDLLQFQEFVHILCSHTSSSSGNQKWICAEFSSTALWILKFWDPDGMVFPPALIFWGYVYSLDCPPRLSWRFLSSVVS